MVYHTQSNISDPGLGRIFRVCHGSRVCVLLVTTSVTMSVVVRITARESILRIGAGIPIGSRVKTLAGECFVMNLNPARKLFLGENMPNDLLSIWL